MGFTTNLAITTSNSIKLQASSLAQLTQATNQLTRSALVRFYFVFFLQKKILIKIDDCIRSVLSIISCFIFNINNNSI